MLPCLPFRGFDVADGVLALAMGVFGAFCHLAVLCGIPSSFFFLHSEVVGSLTGVICDSNR